MMRILPLMLLLLLPALVSAESDEAWIVDAYHRSFAHEGVQKYDEAIKALQPVLERYPDTYTVNLRLGWLHYLAGRHANAREHYQRAIRAVPGAVEARLGLLLPLLAQERHADAEQVAVQVLRTDLYNYYGNLRLLLALKGQGKYASARVVAQRMLALYPADVTFLGHLASLDALEGRHEDALRRFRVVYILDPENPAARRYLKLDGD